MRRGVLLGGVIGAVVLAAGVGWFFGRQIRSPAELAADAAPPEPSSITVEVSREVLSADVITRGDIVYDEPVQLSLSGSFAGQPEALVVTQAAEVDAELVEGDVAVEVTGRPVFLLEGELPMYRDLRPGAFGEDVLQLERALGRLGFFDGEPDEVWDDATGAAVAAWYGDAGYRPNGLSEEDESALKAARDRVRSAEAAVADTEVALSEAGSGPDRSTIRSAEAEIESAKDALELAELDAEHAKSQAGDARRAASAAVGAAQSEAGRTERRLAQARNGKHPDTGEPPTRVELTELEQDVAAAKAAVRDAETALSDAEFEVDRVAAEQAAMLRQAKSRVDVATATLADVRSPMNTSGLNRQVQLARDELAEAGADLTALEATFGTWLPAGEIIFIKGVPVRVDQVAVSRGSVIVDSFLTVSGSEVALHTAVLERDASLVEEGMRVEIENPESDVTIEGTVTTVAERAGTQNVAGDRVYVEVAVEDLPGELIGTNVRVTIPVSSTGGEVLAVPAAALSAAADGSTRVEVDNDGSLRTVIVETGLAAGGLVQVTPIDGELDEGDLVVVGRESGD